MTDIDNQRDNGNDNDYDDDDVSFCLEENIH